VPITVETEERLVMLSVGLKGGAVGQRHKWYRQDPKQECQLS
jgi:hypothetical protein